MTAVGEIKSLFYFVFPVAFFFLSATEARLLTSLIVSTGGEKIPPSGDFYIKTRPDISGLGGGGLSLYGGEFYAWKKRKTMEEKPRKKNHARKTMQEKPRKKNHARKTKQEKLSMKN